MRIPSFHPASRFFLPCLLLCALCAISAPPRAGAEVEQRLQSDRRNLELREYYLRIGVVQDASTLRVTPLEDFLIHDRGGRVLYEGKGGTPIRFTSHDTHPARTAYYFLLHPFTEAALEEARDYAQRARRLLGIAVDIIPDPRLDHTPSPHGASTPRRYYVAAGPYPDREAARRVEPIVFGQYDPEIFKTMESEAEGVIEARDAEGRLLATAGAYLGLRPREREARMRGGALNSADKAWASPAKWNKDPSYRGLMEVWVNPRGRLSLVNRVFIEHYLMGVVPPEIGTHAPLEMMKVQAMISRSEAIAKLGMNRHGGWNYDLVATQQDQVYKGADVEHPDCTQAVRETWGQVAIYEGEIIDAVYSMICGGVTAACHDAWGGKVVPYLRQRIDAADQGLDRKFDFSEYKDCERWINSRPDVFCNPDGKSDYPSYAKKYFRWKRVLMASQLARELKEEGYSRIDRVTNIGIARRTASGLITSVFIDAEPRGRFYISNGYAIRVALDSLPSNFFTLDRDYDSSERLTRVTLKGAGKGHGVGLCQMGATMMARQGYNYVEILEHYFPGSEVYRVYR